jgi:hypothetical protein
MTEILRLMPEKYDLGRHSTTTMAAPMGQREDIVKNADWYDIAGRRTIMGYILPSWQRPLVWKEDQKIRFIESAWLGLNLGTFTYNRVDTLKHPLDSLLIDGQQRMSAIQDYLDDEFPVFGYRWSEITVPDRRRFNFSTTFASYITQSEDEKYLRDYYNMMNFGGTAHKEDERA